MIQTIIFVIAGETSPTKVPAAQPLERVRQRETGIGTDCEDSYIKEL